MKKILIPVAFVAIVLTLFAFNKNEVSLSEKAQASKSNWIWLTYRGSTYSKADVEDLSNWVEDPNHNPATACESGMEIACAIHIPEENLTGDSPNRIPNNSIIIQGTQYGNTGNYYVSLGYGTAIFNPHNTYLP